MLTIPGFLNGKIGSPWIRALASIPITLGLIMISTIELTSPTRRPATAPAVLKRRQKILKHDHRQIRARRDREGEAHQESDVDGLQLDREQDRDRADHEGGDARHAHFFARPPFPSVVDHVRVEIVSEAGARTDRQAGDDREDRGKRDRADKGEENFAAQRLRQQRRAHVFDADLARRKNRGRAEPEKRRHDVEGADDDHRPDDRVPGGPGIGHGVKSHQNVGQPGRAENKREPERDQVDRAPGRFEEQARLEKIARDHRRRPRRSSSRWLIASKKALKLNPKCFITRIDRKMLPLMSNTALMIWTQVVASIPPKTT